jgi:hypothetical protein
MRCKTLRACAAQPPLKFSRAASSPRALPSLPCSSPGCRRAAAVRPTSMASVVFRLTSAPMTRRSWLRAHRRGGVAAAAPAERPQLLRRRVPRGGGVSRASSLMRTVTATARRSAGSSSPSVTSAGDVWDEENFYATQRMERWADRCRRRAFTEEEIDNSNSTARTRGGTIFGPRPPPTTSSFIRILICFNFLHKNSVAMFKSNFPTIF